MKVASVSSGARATVLRSDLQRGGETAHVRTGWARWIVLANRFTLTPAMDVVRTIDPWKPTRAQLAAASTKKLSDVIAARLDILFCGINPGLYSAAVGHHFARPGNRFWPTLFAAGFTARLFTGFDDRELLTLGLGLTNLVARASATADELSSDELRAGARVLRRKVLRYRPRLVAIVGFGAYRTAFERPRAVGGRQVDSIGSTEIWLLPNPSGINASYQPAALARLFEELRVAAGIVPARARIANRHPDMSGARRSGWIRPLER